MNAPRCAIALLSWNALLAADDPAEKIRAAMQPALDKQKASVRRQARTAEQIPDGGFFTIPWPTPPALALPVLDCDPLPAREIDPIIDDSARRHGVKPQIIRAVIQKESAGRPCAESVKGAQGLMQIMPVTASDYGVADPFEPKQNIDAGTRYLKALLERFGGDLSLALAAYNAGPLAVEREGGVPKNSETQNYVAEILKLLKVEPAITASPRAVAASSSETKTR
ncbi:MAG TPA: lytic transglycosylase domain-containing protein [Bryobacteraceae bacterium]|nr:lytic transglycosylase domain-containing protein [Bryobacteraceae bacterium]